MYTVKYYSSIKRNAFESVPMRWLNLQSITQTEVSQKEKNKYINAYTWDLEKIVLMNLFREKEWKCRQREQTCGHNGGKRPGQVEKVVLTYTLSYVKQINLLGHECSIG